MYISDKIFIKELIGEFIDNFFVDLNYLVKENNNWDNFISCYSI